MASQSFNVEQGNIFDLVRRIFKGKPLIDERNCRKNLFLGKILLIWKFLKRVDQDSILLELNYSLEISIIWGPEFKILKIRTYCLKKSWKSIIFFSWIFQILCLMFFFIRTRQFWIDIKNVFRGQNSWKKFSFSFFGKKFYEVLLEKSRKDELFFSRLLIKNEQIWRIPHPVIIQSFPGSRLIWEPTRNF